MHRYLAPKSWKEWTREGVLQAFIIAFYAEMYGLPLTNCLARFFGLDLAWTEGGNFRAQRFGTPIAHVVAMVIGYTIVFAGATLVADGVAKVSSGQTSGPSYDGRRVWACAPPAVHRPVSDRLRGGHRALAYDCLGRGVQLACRVSPRPITGATNPRRRNRGPTAASGTAPSSRFSPSPVRHAVQEISNVKTRPSWR